MSRSDGVRLWLLELDLGHVYRFATEPAALLSEQGVPYTYDAGLSDPGTSFGEASADDVSIGIEVLSEVDWALLTAQGIPLEGRWATLRRWTVGTTLERAWVLRGRLSGVRHGVVGETFSATITRSVTRESDTLPHPQAVIDATTWPITALHTIPDQSLGVPYPVVIGCPGHVASGNALPLVPVVYAQTNVAATSYIVVSDGLIDAAQVRIYDFNASPPTSGDRPVTQVTDLLGRVVSVTTTAILNLAGRWFVGFKAASGYGGGILHRGEMIRGAGDVWRWVLEAHVDIAVDWGRFEAVRRQLNAYKVDTSLNAGTNVWEWFVGEVLPLLPVEIRESSHGMYPAILRWGATARDAVAHLDATRGSGRVTRTSGVEWQGEIRNEISILYRPTGEGDTRWTSRRVATSKARRTAIDPAGVDDERIRGSQLLSDSQLAYGALPLTIEAACVSDDATAELVLRDRIRAHAWPRRALSYEGGPWLESLEVGAIVTVTDPDLYLASAVAILADVVPGETAGVELVLLDHPLQIRRST